jgi:hypothetical protein
VYLWNVQASFHCPWLRWREKIHRRLRQLPSTRIPTYVIAVDCGIILIFVRLVVCFFFKKKNRLKLHFPILNFSLDCGAHCDCCLCYHWRSWIVHTKRTGPSQATLEDPNMREINWVLLYFECMLETILFIGWVI